jgi:hypothetical protein
MASLFVPDDPERDPLRRGDAAEAADARGLLDRHANLGPKFDILSRGVIGVLLGEITLATAAEAPPSEA